MNPTYYFINHTCKQICKFDHTLSIFESIDIALKKNYIWKNTDSIHIDFELSYWSLMWEYYTDTLGYTDVDYKEIQPFHTIDLSLDNLQI